MSELEYKDGSFSDRVPMCMVFSQSGNYSLPHGNDKFMLFDELGSLSPKVHSLLIQRLIYNEAT